MRSPALAIAWELTKRHRWGLSAVAAYVMGLIWCTDQRPVPMVVFHGTADRLTPYQGGSSWMAPVALPDVPSFAANWAQRNGCAPGPTDSAVATDVTRRAYTNCAGDAAVVLYTIQDGGHSWPAGTPVPEWFAGPTSRNVDATREMWAFFREHPLSRGNVPPNPRRSGAGAESWMFGKK